MDYKEQITAFRELAGYYELTDDHVVFEALNNAADSMSELLDRANAAEARCKRLSEELEAYTDNDLAKAHEVLSIDWAKQKCRAEKAEKERNAAL